MIFAGIGATLTLPDAQGIREPVVSAATFGAVVIMVIVTTLVTPPVLKWALTRGSGAGGQLGSRGAPAPEGVEENRPSVWPGKT